jgi:stringent starvation protein B
MRKIRLEEIEKGTLPKGSLIMVRWLDASDVKALLSEHEERPEAYCKDWGIYLGVSGRKRKMLIIAKDVVEFHHEWGATRIPMNLIEEVVLVLPREEVAKMVREVEVITRKVHLRKHSREVRIRVVMV